MDMKINRFPGIPPGLISGMNRRQWLGAILGAGSLGLGGRKAVSQSMMQLVKMPGGEIWGKPIPIDQECNVQLFSPERPAGTSKSVLADIPLIFLFGGNGMGAVVKSSQALQLAGELQSRGCAAAVLNHPELQTRMDFHRSIIGPMHKIIGSDWAKQNCIDTQKIGAAGFSAGGLIATLLGTVYQRELNFKIQAALNYYGPVDLRQWFAFHMVGAGEMQYDSFYDGVRGPDEIGHSANGEIRCRDLSQRVILKVAQNLGGMAPGRLHPFSHECLWNDRSDCGLAEPMPIMGIFGTKDDNCDSVFQSRLLMRMAEKTGARHEVRIYQGLHGVGWDACPESVDWMIQQLESADRSPATLIA